MNKVFISGRIVRDLEPKYTQAGKCHVSFTLAVDKGFGDNKKTLWIYCTAWEKTAEVMGNTLAKGRKILVEGEMDQYESEKDGVKKSTTQILVRNFEYCDSKPDNASAGSASTPAPATPPASGYDVSSFGQDVFPEEQIPF